MGSFVEQHSPMFVSLFLTHQRRVGAPDDGDAQRLARPRDLDVGDLTLEHRQPRYACKKARGSGSYVGSFGPVTHHGSYNDLHAVCAQVIIAAAARLANRHRYAVCV